jgi:hypothetical protein
MSIKAIDDLLVKVQQNEPVEPLTEVKSSETESESPRLVDNQGESEAKEGESEEKLTHLEQFRKDKEEFLAKQDEKSNESDDNSQEDVVDDISHPSETDDYGNKVPKSKTYTEEEVQAMIRKRLKLHHEEKAQQQPQYQPPQQQYQPPNEEFQHDQSSEQPWEVQLENHIKQTVQKLETEKVQVAWQQEEQRNQVEFESRFTNGMSKYSDFNDVVQGKPITNGIMMAARSMADPAAFIYAVSKQHPQELERISQIRDPYVQAAEVGRLEERMKKARTVSKAPKPIAKTKGDIADKGNIKQNLDDLIRHDAKRKLGRR